MTKKVPHSQNLSSTPDDLIAELAARQAGVISSEQLRGAGLRKGARSYRATHSKLHRVHWGVYAVGVPRLTPRGWLWAAVLARGGPENAALSHRSAAGLWDLLDAGSGRVDVTTRRQASSTQAILAHHSRTLDWDRDVITLDDGLPITTVARTLIDLADVLTPYQLERVVHRAAYLGLLDVAAIRIAPGRRSRALTAALDSLADDEPRITRNTFEEAMLGLCASANLPLPRCNVPLLGYVADFFWPEHRLVVETDGREHWRRARRYEHDRERDATMLLAGYRVVRFTWRQLQDRPDYVIATLRALLGV